MLLLLSNSVPPSAFGAIGGCEGWAEWCGVGVPVKSRFLKLSTSNAALVLPGVVLSAPVRSAALAVSCGSSEANVRAKGFGGTPLGDRVD